MQMPERPADNQGGGLKIKQQVKDMIYYGSPILVNFPRAEKQMLARRIRETMYEMLHICNEIARKYYKKDTLQRLDVLLDDLRDYLELAQDVRLYPQGTQAKKKKKPGGQQPPGDEQQEPRPSPRACITRDQYKNWCEYTRAIGGMIGNYKKYVAEHAPSKTK